MWLAIAAWGGGRSCYRPQYGVQCYSVVIEYCAPHTTVRGVVLGTSIDACAFPDPIALRMMAEDVVLRLAPFYMDCVLL